MPLKAIIVIIIVSGTIVNIMVPAIKDIMATHTDRIREDTMIMMTTDIDTITLAGMDLITIAVLDTIGIIITRATRASLNI